MKIYCMYGIGVPTERSYYYAMTDEKLEEECIDHNSTGCAHETIYEHAISSSNDDREAHNALRPPHLVSYVKYNEILYANYMYQNSTLMLTSMILFNVLRLVFASQMATALYLCYH